MKYSTYFSVLGSVFVSALLFACTSKKNGNEEATGGPDGTEAISIGYGGNGGSASASTGPRAEESVDGTQEITSEQADTLLNDANAVCEGWAIEAEPEQSVIEFLVDVSGSMNDASPSTGGLSKWSVTREALKKGHFSPTAYVWRRSFVLSEHGG